MNCESLFNEILNTDSFNEKLMPIGKGGQLAIKCDKDNKLEKIWDFMGDSSVIPVAFINAYNQCATALEKNRIHQLNSSSLLPLLCFWNVNTKGLIIDGVQYTSAIFEAKNKVFTKDSSVDVVLVSADGLNWLFLESKFTEPLSPRPYLDIKAPYKNIYDSIKSILNVEISDIREEYDHKKHKMEYLFSILSLENHYWEGIKQMLSHLIGIVQGPGAKAKHDHIKEGVKVKLGTILFDFSEHNVQEYSTAYEDYVNTYSRIFSKVHSNQIISSLKRDKSLKINLDTNCLEVIDKPLTYQDVFKNQNPDFLLPNVAKFYSLE